MIKTLTKITFPTACRAFFCADRAASAFCAASAFRAAAAAAASSAAFSAAFRVAAAAAFRTAYSSAAALRVAISSLAFFSASAFAAAAAAAAAASAFRAAASSPAFCAAYSSTAFLAAAALALRVAFFFSASAFDAAACCACRASVTDFDSSRARRRSSRGSLAPTVGGSGLLRSITSGAAGATGRLPGALLWGGTARVGAASGATVAVASSKIVSRAALTSPWAAFRMRRKITGSLAMGSSAPYNSFTTPCSSRTPASMISRIAAADRGELRSMSDVCLAARWLDGFVRNSIRKRAEHTLCLP